MLARLGTMPVEKAINVVHINNDSGSLEGQTDETEKAGADKDEAKTQELKHLEQ